MRGDHVTQVPPVHGVHPSVRIALHVLGRYAPSEVQTGRCAGYHEAKHLSTAAFTDAINGALFISCAISSGFKPTPASAALT